MIKNSIINTLYCKMLILSALSIFSTYNVNSMEDPYRLEEKSDADLLLSQAISNKDYGLALDLLDQGAKPQALEVINVSMQTLKNKPLFDQFIKKAIENGLDSNINIQLSPSPPEPLLVHAIGSLDYDLTEYLLEHGADPKKEYYDSNYGTYTTPSKRAMSIHKAMQENIKRGLFGKESFDREASQKIINLIASHLLTKHQNEIDNLFVQAVSSPKPNYELAFDLLRQGANPNKIKKLNMPFMIMIKYKQLISDFIKEAIEKGLSSNITVTEGTQESPLLSYAIDTENPNLVKYLLDHNAEPQKKYYDNHLAKETTPLERGLLVYDMNLKNIKSGLLKPEEVDLEASKRIKDLFKKYQSPSMAQKSISPEHQLSRLTNASYNEIYNVYQELRRAKHGPLGSIIDNNFTENLKNSLNIPDLSFIYNSGFFFIGSESLMRGNTKSLIIGGKEQVFDTITQKIKTEDVNRYKIHLMPKNESDLMAIIENLLNELKDNSDLQNSLHDFKFHPIDFSVSKEDIKKQLLSKEGTLPIIVIYPGIGKNNAQFVLDTIYKLFGHLEGLDITPRYNKKVTSLIYYAQGDSLQKSNNERDYMPDKIFFRPDYEGVGMNVDYSLKSSE
jgi:ankyrin repeat protein